MTKPGHPDDRKAVANFARTQRAKFPNLHGGWTRRQWNVQVHLAMHNNLTRLTAARRKR